MSQSPDSNQDYRTPENLLAVRRGICFSCEHLDDDKITCKECGCPLVEKAAYLPQKCPLNKWPYNPITGPGEDDITTLEEN